MIPIRRPWTRPPHSAARVNGANPLATGLRDLWAREAMPLGARGGFVRGANGSYLPTEHGVVLRGSGSANVATLAPGLSPFTEATVTALIYVDAWATGSGYNMLWEVTADAAANNGGVALYYGNTAGVKMSVVTKGTAASVTRQNGTAPSAGAWHVITSRHRIGGASAAESCRLAVDGVDVNLPSGGTSTSGGTLSGSAINLLSRNAATLPTTGSIALFAVHGRWLADEEVAALGRTLQAPWQLFEPRSIIIPGAAAASGLPTLTGITLSNITTSGYRATVSGS